MKLNFDALEVEIEKLQLKPGDILAVKVFPELPHGARADRMGEDIKAMLPEGAQVMLHGANEVEISVKPGDTIPLTDERVKGYLDGCITSWRKTRETSREYKNNMGVQVADCYIDAFQSVRTSLFGELLD